LRPRYGVVGVVKTCYRRSAGVNGPPPQRPVKKHKDEAYKRRSASTGVEENTKGIICEYVTSLCMLCRLIILWKQRRRVCQEEGHDQ
jgi:hypothetical protein